MLKRDRTGKSARNSHEMVVDGVGKAIVAGAYAPNTLLPGDTELAERYGVSRTVLREAMKTLAAKGMIVPKARIGTRVTDRTRWNHFDADVLAWHIENESDEDFLERLSEMRLSFEPFAARLAARRATNENIDRLYAGAEAMRTARTIDAFAAADLDLHMALIEASRNPFMHSLGHLVEAALALSFRLSSPIREPARQQRSALLHRRIAEAVESRDPEAAARAVEDVILAGRERVRGAGGSGRDR